MKLGVEKRCSGVVQSRVYGCYGHVAQLFLWFPLFIIAFNVVSSNIPRWRAMKDLLFLDEIPLQVRHVAVMSRLLLLR
jgi:hypothetical protein